jgi:hypothetical protein
VPPFDAQACRPLPHRLKVRRRTFTELSSTGSSSRGATDSPPKERYEGSLERGQRTATTTSSSTTTTIVITPIALSAHHDSSEVSFDSPRISVATCNLGTAAARAIDTWDTE